MQNYIHRLNRMIRSFNEVRLHKNDVLKLFYACEIRKYEYESR